MFNRRRRASHGSQSSSGSMSSAKSAASSMSDDELDNFRSMRGKSGHNSIDLSQHMTDDVDDLTARLRDVKQSREMERKLFDTTGQPYTILITSKDVRLMHVDEKGHYHFNHFNSEKHRAANGKPPHMVKQRWRVIDQPSFQGGTDHIFANITPSWVTIYHRNGTWQCRRFKGRIYEIENSERTRPVPPQKRSRSTGANEREDRTWLLYGEHEANSDRSSNASPDPEPLLCANTPNEKGQHHRAHQSFYHDL